MDRIQTLSRRYLNGELEKRHYVTTLVMMITNVSHNKDERDLDEVARALAYRTLAPS